MAIVSVGRVAERNLASEFAFTPACPMTFRASKLILKTGFTDFCAAGIGSPAFSGKGGTAGVRSNTSLVSFVVSSWARTPVGAKRPTPPMTSEFWRGTWIHPSGSVSASTPTVMAGPNCIIHEVIMRVYDPVL